MPTIAEQLTWAEQDVWAERRGQRIRGFVVLKSESQTSIKPLKLLKLLLHNARRSSGLASLLPRLPHADHPPPKWNVGRPRRPGSAGSSPLGSLTHHLLDCACHSLLHLSCRCFLPQECHVVGKPRASWTAAVLDRNGRATASILACVPCECGGSCERGEYSGRTDPTPRSAAALTRDDHKDA